MTSRKAQSGKRLQPKIPGLAPLRPRRGLIRGSGPAFAELSDRYHPAVAGGGGVLTVQECEALIAAGVFQPCLAE